MRFNFLLVIGLVACGTTPETKRRQLNFIPDGQMDRMGAEAYAEITAKTARSTNSALQARVEKIGRRIAAASSVKQDWAFVLLDEPETVNAFCLPGGKVAVYTGIVPIAATDAGLAAVLGHEVAHAVLRHGAERLSQGLAAQAGLALAELSFKDSKFKSLIAGALGVGVQFGVMLPFSRAHEAEADRVGLKYMAAAGYDPHAAVSLWERMGKASSGATGPELLSTHPDPAGRARELEKQLSRVQGIYAASEQQPEENL